MPGGLPSSLLNFLATHLVALCLLAFLVVGLQLSGTQQRGVAAPESPSENAVVPELGESPSVDDAGIGNQVGSDALKPPVTAPGEAGPQDYQPPRMIGGSIPIHGEQAPLPQAVVPDQGLPFRPPGRHQFQLASPPTRDEMVQQARRAFWNGDFEGAESAYMSVISAYPEDADAFGELGNLYQAMGKDEQAMDAYFEAGILLEQAGEREKLKQIIDLFVKKGDQRIHRFTP